jgi:hypothetical protein
MKRRKLNAWFTRGCLELIAAAFETATYLHIHSRIYTRYWTNAIQNSVVVNLSLFERYTSLRRRLAEVCQYDCSGER